MICPSCGAGVGDDAHACSSCGEEPALDGRYYLLDIIGRGGAGVTYRARRLSDREIVCVKELAYNRLADFDAQKMFEREASVLRQLSHPGIPEFVDHFAAGEGKALSLYLVQEYVRGHTLEEEMEAYRYNELEVLAILDELGGILAYLEDLRPRVVHRDIKPANIIRRDADNRLMLVDFGSVKATTQADGETIVGTAGYMAPEQTWGTATPQADLYSLGVLGVVLLSRRDPHELLDTNHTFQWEQHVDCTPATRELLSQLLRANPDERPGSADVVGRAIQRAREQIESGTASPDPEPSSSPSSQRAIPQEARRTAPGEMPDGHNHSEARPKRLALVLVALGAVLVLGIGVFISLLSFSPSSESAVETISVTNPKGPSEKAMPSEPQEPPRCPSGDCEDINVPFKSGLVFGMSEEEVAKTLEQMGEVEAVEPRTVTHRKVTGEDEHAEALPGKRFVVETKTAGEPSTCYFDLAVNGRLSAATCRLEPMSSLSSHRSAMKRIQSALTERYGRHSDDNFSTVVEGSVVDEKNNWSWSGGGAQIVLTSRFRRVSGDVQESVLLVEQMTSRHRELVEDAQERSLESFEKREAELESEPL